MDTETRQFSPDEGEAEQVVPQQQQPEPATEGHAGQGSDSAMKQMRIWEQRRASNTIGRRRQGPH